ncbi:MAG: fumarylacetoacetate hydrolase family protein, partial [Planctomycetes bacterium]|nr:fumarylacetoacetate hydrolase family protein [Planctomycetota bacterium]
AALTLNERPIRIPPICSETPQVDFEGELGVVIGRNSRDVPVDRALDAVLGYTVANDVSARWWQKQGSGKQFFRGKSFDSFCPIGPHVVPARDLPDPQSLRLRTWVGTELMQEAQTSEMIFSVAELIAELSRGMTLLQGTLLLTGTPGGVGFARVPPRFLRDGDRVSIEIEGIGRLENPVVEEQV